MWINGDWRVAESGWCRVINQHNECRWALCRWSPHSGLCHPAGSLFAPLQCFSIALTVFPRHVSLASLFNLWAHFCMISFYSHLTLTSPWWLSQYTTLMQIKISPVCFTFHAKWYFTILSIFKCSCCCKNLRANCVVCQTRMELRQTWLRQLVCICLWLRHFLTTTLVLVVYTVTYRKQDKFCIAFWSWFSSVTWTLTPTTHNALSSSQRRHDIDVNNRKIKHIRRKFIWGQDRCEWSSATLFIQRHEQFVDQRKIYFKTLHLL